MGLFDEMLRGDESLFLESMALDVDYMPPIVKFRENEQQYIATCIKPLFSKRSGKNLVISGAPGIGKTVTIKHVIQELHEQTSDIVTLYVNCWKKDTPHKIISELCQQAGFTFIAGRTTDELVKALTNILNKKACVIVLDEADKIDDQQLFYTLFEDIFTKTIICITNERDWLSKLDDRVRSRMLAEMLEFKAYNHTEFSELLRERVRYAFVPNVFQEEGLQIIIDKAFEIGDVRSGLFLLKQAGEEAEMKAQRAITLEHAHQAITRLEDFHRKSTQALGEEETFLLNVIKAHSGKTSRELFESYTGAGGKQAHSTFQRKLQHLHKNKFITLTKITIGKGRSTRVTYGGPEQETSLNNFSS